MLQGPTLVTLIEMARKNRIAASRRFKKWDNIDDMNEMNHWQFTEVWLKSLLKK